MLESTLGHPARSGSSMRSTVPGRWRRQIPVLLAAVVLCGCSSPSSPPAEDTSSDVDVVSCRPSCDDRECGDDGCGGSCGACVGGLHCDDGLCVLDCVPDCDGIECGDDGCKGSCGTCEVGACVFGVCKVPCEPSCEGLECGEDGCGGSCGDCVAPAACEAGICVEPCPVDCAGKVCGDDGCGGSCGTCPPGIQCVDGQCTAPPEECGECPAGTICGFWFPEPDWCAAESCPPFLDASGDCVDDGNTLIWCEEAMTFSVDCDHVYPGTACLWDEESAQYACLQCMPDCTGQVCGGDGCGGSCGNCPPEAVCEQGECYGLPDSGCGVALQGGSLYAICTVAEGVSWGEAEASCAAWDGALVILASDEELLWLVEQAGGKIFWVGLTDQEVEGTWGWGDGTSAADYSSWCTGEPNNFGGAEDCAVAGWGGGCFNDIPCDSNSAGIDSYVCEKSAAVDPR